MNPFEQLGVAFVFCGVLAALVWLLRSRKLSVFASFAAPAPSPYKFNVLARRGLTPHHTLHIVSVAGGVFLVATHPHGYEIKPLAELVPGAAPGVVA